MCLNSSMFQDKSWILQFRSGFRWFSTVFAIDFFGRFVRQITHHPPSTSGPGALCLVQTRAWAWSRSNPSRHAWVQISGEFWTDGIAYILLEIKMYMNFDSTSQWTRWFITKKHRQNLISVWFPSGPQVLTHTVPVWARQMPVMLDPTSWKVHLCSPGQL